ncbi:MAG: hypothetical protein A2X61_11730 [Ignavibacteria bacterium GWB2_35_12]|nr:MAG: hypothetical protein A2X61_11730 [Ignavibacteria bacterium GWB2_35_12]OGU94559.1 MAG: hypothetical protein A2220_01535 [Ignavibacteria bacterium RIFOXYA2_FULL_35_10]OGV22436.1 MAG: hypothetical protein A2475_15590 [Ignavibacteria bacterium RIFOXYC2_FULL_35_21]
MKEQIEENIMKTIFKILFVTGFLSFFAQNAKAEDSLNPCWDMVLPHDPDHGFYNPDSVLYDTCLCKVKPWLPPYCEYMYAKQWFGIDLPNGALNIPQAPRDSIILRNWRDIDSSFTDMRAGFENLENVFGNFVFKKVYPDIIDTEKIASRYFNLRFDNYVKIDSASYLLHQIPDIKTEGYLGRYDFIKSVNDSNDDKLNNFNIIPNPCNDYIQIHLDERFINNDNIQIITLQGILIFNEKISELNVKGDITLNTSKFSNGIYFINYENIIQLLIVLH